MFCLKCPMFREMAWSNTIKAVIMEGLWVLSIKNAKLILADCKEYLCPQSENWNYTRNFDFSWKNPKSHQIIGNLE